MSRDLVPRNSLPIAYVISRGRAADFLTRLALPVVAFPPRRLYRVIVRGHGFEMPVDQADPIVEFIVTLFVAARTAGDAQAVAVQRAKDRWETFYQEASGQLVVTVDLVELLSHRFARRSRIGFSFFSGDDGPPAR